MNIFDENAVLRFKQATAADVVKNRIRIRPANTVAEYDEPYEDVAKKEADADGYTRIPLKDLASAAALDGTYDFHVTAVDDAGRESTFLEVDNVTFDLAPPDAPTDGAIE